MRELMREVSLGQRRWRLRVVVYKGSLPDVVRLALVQGSHETMKLFAELQSHAVELESTPAPSFGRNRLHNLALLEEIPAHKQSWLPRLLDS